MKKIGFIFILFSFLGLWFSSSTYLEEKLLDPQARIIKHWHKDLAQLKDQLPASWKKVSQVEINYGDMETQIFFRDIKEVPIQVNKEGSYKLVLTVITAEQELFIFQHNMIHIPTGEMVWELARTYQLNEPSVDL